MNACITMKTFPTPFRFAYVSSTSKSNSNDNMNKGNFRHGSIHSILTALYECILNDQMLDHFQEMYEDGMLTDMIYHMKVAGSRSRYMPLGRSFVRQPRKKRHQVVVTFDRQSPIAGQRRRYLE